MRWVDEDTHALSPSAATSATKKRHPAEVPPSANFICQTCCAAALFHGDFLPGVSASKGIPLNATLELNLGQN
jgi:hypothetical protein